MAAVAPVAAVGLEAVIGLDTLNQIIGQLLNVLLINLLAPDLDALRVTAYDKLPVEMNPPNPLTPADAVEAVIKGHLSQSQGAQEARFAGLSQDRFATMIASAGEPPGLDFLTEAFRRGFIPKAGTGPEAVSLEQGIRESRLKNKWTPTIEQMQYRLPDPAVVIEGWLRAQIDPQGAYDYLAKSGIDKATADLWYKSSGRPPGPQELIELHRRGVIPEAGEGGDTLSLRQGYLETDLKNKWYPIWKELVRYVPPPRTVTAMVREGAFTDEQAAKFYADAGLDKETTAAYLTAAHHQRVAATKELSKATILKLYSDRLMSAEQTTAALGAEGYAKETAAYEMEAADFQQEAKLIDAVLTRLRTLYIAHKLDKATALAALTDLGLEPAAREHQLSYWDQARQNNVAILTPAQIAEAVKLGWLDGPTAIAYLEGHGYSNPDAQLFLLTHLKLTPGDNLPAGITLAGA